MPRSIKGSIHIGDVFKLKAFSPRVNFITSASKNRYLQKRIGFFSPKSDQFGMDADNVNPN
jgi:hypothetical protein